MDQLVGEHADHSFVRRQTRQKNCSEYYRPRVSQQYGSVVARVHVRTNVFNRFHASNGPLNFEIEAFRAANVVIPRQLFERSYHQPPRHRKQVLGTLRASNRFGTIYRKRWSGLHVVDGYAASWISHAFVTNSFAGHFNHLARFG